jgi:hypothetical protein
VIVTIRKRGFLTDTHVTDSKTGWKPPFRQDGKVALRALPAGCVTIWMRGKMPVRSSCGPPAVVRDGQPAGRWWRKLVR